MAEESVYHGQRKMRDLMCRKTIMFILNLQNLSCPLTRLAGTSVGESGKSHQGWKKANVLQIFPYLR